MINKETIQTLTEEWLQGNDYFLVDISFAADDRIVIEIDHADGVWIEDCAELSRFLQERLGDELGEYELEVGSAGLGQPFKVAQQYVNHIGDTIEVLDLEGKKLQGTLKAVEGNSFTLTVQEKQKQEGKKRPVLVEVDKTYQMDGVKYAKYLLTGQIKRLHFSESPKPQVGMRSTTRNMFKLKEYGLVKTFERRPRTSTAPRSLVYLKRVSVT